MIFCCYFLPNNLQQSQTMFAPQLLRLVRRQAVLYPNAYINFNQNGEYTKHYYSGTERICSRLGDAYVPMTASADSRTWVRRLRADALFRSQIGELVSYEEPPAPAIPADRSGGTRELVFPPVEYEPFLSIPSLQPTGTPDDIFYYHTNHLGSTAYVTDNNATITQGFLYAPFGEITTEFDANFGSDIIPKYSFNAKELDEETGMYYYEARYYKPPVFTSRDPMFEKYFWMTPYAYCANNPVKYVDPSGEDWFENELTGAIYYNNRYGKEAAGKGAMKGAGWKHLGGNNMFSSDGISNSDYSIVLNNGGSLFYGYGALNMELSLSLNGEQAKSLMETLGYKQVPTQVITYNDTYLGIYRFQTSDLKRIIKYTFNVYSLSSYTGCSRKLKTITVIKPKKNEFSNLDICKHREVVNFYYCKKWASQEFNKDATDIEQNIRKRIKEIQGKTTTQGHASLSKMALDEVNRRLTMILVSAIVAFVCLFVILICTARISYNNKNTI